MRVSLTYDGVPIGETKVLPVGGDVFAAGEPTGAVGGCACAVGAGAGRVVAITYEYGNTFLIVAGLLNMLVVLDAFDIAKGRK